MTDIVERLRALAREYHQHRPHYEEAADRIERLEEALQRIEEWSRAYSLTVFPKPDLKLARELLGKGGMTLDAISADAMRHVIEGVGMTARIALKED